MTRGEAIVIWFTGLSSAGKSTVADGIEALLREDGIRVLILDGDDVRRRYHRHLGFSADDIKTNNRLIVDLCRAHRDRYDVLLVPIISPYVESRLDARRRLSPGFFEIHCTASLETVRQRDVKGLYSKAQNGEIGNLIGVSPETPYQPPASPDLRLHTGHQSPDDSIERLTRWPNRKMGDVPVWRGVSPSGRPFHVAELDDLG